MLGAMLIGSVALLGADGALPPETAAAYREAAARAGRDPDAQVKLALWCEAHGLTAERTKHLALAVLGDPANALARGLLGMVEDGGKWRRPDEVARRIQADADQAAALAEYNAKRAMAPPTAEGQWKLALWCEGRGLKAEATAHLTAVVWLDPSREEAWKRLGYKKVGGRWMTDEQVAAAKADAEAQRKADRHWKALLEKWRAWLDRPEKRDEAEAGLAALSDPRAVPAVLRVFFRSDPRRAAQLLSQIDAASSSRALALLAVASPSGEVRRIAAETLKSRDVREYADLLIGFLRDPVRYEVRPVGGPGSPGVLFIEGQRANLRRVYAPPAVPQVAPPPGSWVSYDNEGLPVLNWASSWGFQTDRMTIREAQAAGAPLPPANAQLASFLNSPALNGTGPILAGAFDAQSPRFAPGSAGGLAQLPANANVRLEGTQAAQYQLPVGQMVREAQRSAAVAQEQLKADIATLEAQNAEIHRANERVVEILNNVSGMNLKADRNEWLTWFGDQLGYPYTPAEPGPRPTVSQEVPLAYVPRPVGVSTDLGPPVFTGVIPIGTHGSCFAAGTMVRTLMGPRPIESIAVGDRVLSQDTTTGELSFEPIQAVHHNPPSPTLDLVLEGGDTVVTTPFHRLWVAGQGWRMARGLKPGDVLRTPEGTTRITRIEPNKVQPVYNLDVLDNRSFFVGAQGVLAHDNSLPDTRLVPFDAPPMLAASGAGKAAR